jgi:small-conductance mechanosensitive channel
LLPDTVLILVTRFAGITAIGADALIQTAVIVALVYLTRADILRRRELYADRTAARLWHAGHDAMPSDGPERTGAESRRARVVAAFVEAWRTHPSWRLRGRSRTDPEELFAMRALPMVITGMLAILIAVVALLMAWTAQFAELRIRTYRGESLDVAMRSGLRAPGLVLAFVLLWWNTGD